MRIFPFVKFMVFFVMARNLNIHKFPLKRSLLVSLQGNEGEKLFVFRQLSIAIYKPVLITLANSISFFLFQIFFQNQTCFLKKKKRKKLTFANHRGWLYICTYRGTAGF